MVISNHFLTDLVHHPIETTILKWMAIRFQVYWGFKTFIFPWVFWGSKGSTSASDPVKDTVASLDMAKVAGQAVVAAANGDAAQWQLLGKK